MSFQSLLVPAASDCMQSTARATTCSPSAREGAISRNSPSARAVPNPLSNRHRPQGVSGASCRNLLQIGPNGPDRNNDDLAVTLRTSRERVSRDEFPTLHRYINARFPPHSGKKRKQHRQAARGANGTCGAEGEAVVVPSACNRSNSGPPPEQITERE